MSQRGFWSLVIICVAALVVFCASPAFGQSMKVVALSVPMPTDEDAQLLAGLRYGYPFSVEFTSVSLRVESEENAKKVKAAWTVTGQSSRARPQRVKIAVFLVDSKGKHIAAAKKNVIVKSNSGAQDYTFKMKAKAEVWSRAVQVKVQVHFLIGA